MKQWKESCLMFFRITGFALILLVAIMLILIGYIFAAMPPNAVGLFFVGIVLLLSGLGILGKLLISPCLRFRNRQGHYELFKLALAGFALVVVISPFVLRKRSIPLFSDGKIIAVARHPFLWGELDCPVWRGNAKLFSLWEDMFDAPWFIYPFADAQRYLCIDDDDTSVMVFVVDLRAPDTNATVSFGWPHGAEMRRYMAGRAPRIVTGPPGAVRLPTFEELEEAAERIRDMPAAQFKRASFPALDLCWYRLYVPKEDLIKQLAPDRYSYWP